MTSPVRCGQTGCSGNAWAVFAVAGVNELGYAELEVGEVNRQTAYMETLLVEPQYLVVVG